MREWLVRIVGAEHAHQLAKECRRLEVAAGDVRADAFERVRKTNPALFQALLAYVVTVMAERLSFANRAI